MCEIVTGMLAAAGKAVATAAGATASAATSLPLAGLGTAMMGGGALVQGISGYQAGKAQARLLEHQARDEQRLNAATEQRTRLQMRAQIARQRAELAGRGVSMDSAAAVLLGQTAATEMAFESQSIRSQGAARRAELTSSATIARGQGMQSLLAGGFNAAGAFMTAAPKLWPELGR